MLKKRNVGKRAAFQDVVFITIFIFAAAIIFLTVTYSYTEVTDRLVNNTIVNESSAAVTAFQDSQDLTNRLDYVIFVLLMGMTLGIIIVSWLIPTNPLFTFLWFIVLVVLVSLAGVLSFVWHRVTELNIFQSTVDAFPITDLILNNFPIYIAVIGFMAMIITLAKPQALAQ